MTLSLTPAVSGTVITSAAYNANLTAIQNAINGGALTGSVVVRGPYSFAYNTASINSGVTVYTPTSDDILIDVWIEVTTAFNGTTPKADVGSFSGTTSGLFDINANAVPLGTADSTTAGGAGISVNTTAGVMTLSSQDGGSTKRMAASRFTSTTPLKLVVSQTGLSGGTAVGGSAGAGKLYIVTATPLAL
jgi:hypothetical protein